MFFIGGQDVPDDEYYDDWPLTENGVGAVRRLFDDFRDGLGEVPRYDGQRMAVVTGLRMGEIMKPLVAPLEQQTGAEVTLLPVRNNYFGETVTTAGLLAGRDIAAELDQHSFDVVLLAAESLNDDEVFVDDYSFAELCARFPDTHIIAAYELTSALIR